MTEAEEILGPPKSPAELEPPRKPSALGTVRHLSGTLLSAALPGAGHLLLGQLPKGMILSALFVALLCCFWPLRLLRFYAGYVVLFLGWIILDVYSAWSAQLIRNPKTGSRPSLWWLALTLPGALIITSLSGAALTRAAGFRSFTVPSTSMAPTIQLGDHIVVDTRAYRHSAPQYRDVIVFYRGGVFYIKRIVAIGGDSIEGRTDRIMVNGNLINESYIQHSNLQSETDWHAIGEDETRSFRPITVQAGKYFVMGDNRDVSLDSRLPEFGQVDGHTITGKVLYVFNTAREGARIR